MHWPYPLDYTEAIQNPGLCFCDTELCRAQPKLNCIGLPFPCTGNFATVFRLDCRTSGRAWAVKCFTRDVPGLALRYREIAAHLQRADLPFAVEFSFLERGILVRGQWFPVLKMRWIEGMSLNEFVGRNTRSARTLIRLADMWLKVAQSLCQASVAHGDLQSGNVLLVPVQDSDAVALKLIDYDGMHVPTLANHRSAEAGHSAYQHPERLQLGDDGLQTDSFSQLVIYTALRCLATAGPKLWNHYDNRENLLFREEDFKDPARSELFHELWNLPCGPARDCAGRLLLSSLAPLKEMSCFDQLFVAGIPRPLTVTEQQRIEAVLRWGAGCTRPAPRMQTHRRQLVAVSQDTGTRPVWLMPAEDSTLPPLPEHNVAVPPRKIQPITLREPRPLDKEKVDDCATAAGGAVGCLFGGISFAWLIPKLLGILIGPWILPLVIFGAVLGLGVGMGFGWLLGWLIVGVHRADRRMVRWVIHTFGNRSPVAPWLAHGLRMVAVCVFGALLIAGILRMCNGIAPPQRVVQCRGVYASSPTWTPSSVNMSSTEGSTASLQMLLDRAAAGDDQTYNQLLARASDRLLRLTRKMFRRFPHLRRWEQTDDVFQQAALRLHQSLSKVRPTTVRDFLGLSATQIRRTLIDLARHHFGPEGDAAKHHSDGQVPAADSSQGVPGGIVACGAEVAGGAEPETMEAWAAFHAAVDALPAEECEVFSLIWYVGATQLEAAETLGISDRTVSRRMLRARVQLGESLRDQFFHGEDDREPVT